MVLQLQTFLELLRLLEKKGHILSMEAFTAGLLPAVSGPLYLLTFDDAWIDTYTNAYPALKNAGIPACVFVPTGLIGKSEYFWVELLSVMWRSWPGKASAIPDALADLFEQKRDPAMRLPQAIALLKRLPIAGRDEIIGRLRSQFSEELPTNQIDKFMNWEQLLSMAPEMAIGSHTVNHVLLDVESPETSDEELRQSKETLERMDCRGISTVAYPNGNCNEAVMRIVANAGYSWAFTTCGGRYRHGSNQLAVPRYLLQEQNVVNPWGKFSQAMFYLRVTY